MYLKASAKEGKDQGIELVQPPPNSKPGDRVYFEGPEYESTDNRFLPTVAFSDVVSMCQMRHRFPS